MNESGRHWYTALNGFRHLEATAPERTVRVWTSADRLFAWMARRLPFVRPDFQDIRADDYPIRLWTVAVFLFGVLPVARKRGLGRLVIGDEYDTTLSVSHKGIPHFAGLFDQSRFFDNALSLYFRKKGWGLAQFSLLRSLSELLGLKVLLERYPELQQHQVSCHAASIRDDRAYPCGKCEKCRRVVSMLVALDGDPTRCGYTPEQVSRCLREVVEKGGVHQEAPVAKQTLWLLSQGGRLDERPRARAPKPSPTRRFCTSASMPAGLRSTESPGPSDAPSIPSSWSTPRGAFFDPAASGCPSMSWTTCPFPDRIGSKPRGRMSPSRPGGRKEGHGPHGGSGLPPG